MSITSRTGAFGPQGWLNPFAVPPARLPAPRLWSEFGRRAANRPLAGLRVLVLGLHGAALALAREELRLGGVRAVAAAADLGPLTNDTRHCRNFDAVIVNFDRFPDVEDGVEAMLDFRRACPAVRVVLVSGGVGADDAGGERRAICDATLRSPFTGARLSAALHAALENAAAGPGA